MQNKQHRRDRPAPARRLDQRAPESPAAKELTAPIGATSYLVPPATDVTGAPAAAASGTAGATTPTTPSTGTTPTTPTATITGVR